MNIDDFEERSDMQIRMDEDFNEEEIIEGIKENYADGRSTPITTDEMRFVNYDLDKLYLSRPWHGGASFQE